MVQCVISIFSLRPHLDSNQGHIPLRGIALSLSYAATIIMLSYL